MSWFIRPCKSYCNSFRQAASRKVLICFFRWFELQVIIISNNIWYAFCKHTLSIVGRLCSQSWFVSPSLCFFTGALALKCCSKYISLQLVFFFPKYFRACQHIYPLKLYIETLHAKVYNAIMMHLRHQNNFMVLQTTCSRQKDVLPNTYIWAADLMIENSHLFVFGCLYIRYKDLVVINVILIFAKLAV